MNLTAAQRLRVLASAGNPYDTAREEALRALLRDYPGHPIPPEAVAHAWERFADGMLLDGRVEFLDEERTALPAEQFRELSPTLVLNALAMAPRTLSLVMELAQSWEQREAALDADASPIGDLHVLRLSLGRPMPPMWAAGMIEDVRLGYGYLAAAFVLDQGELPQDRTTLVKAHKLWESIAQQTFPKVLNEDVNGFVEDALASIRRDTRSRAQADVFSAAVDALLGTSLEGLGFKNPYAPELALHELGLRVVPTFNQEMEGRADVSLPDSLVW